MGSYLRPSSLDAALAALRAGPRTLLAGRLFFVSQVGLAFGCVSVDDAAARLRQTDEAALHV